MFPVRRLVGLAGAGALCLSVAMGASASASDHDVPVPAPVGVSVDGPHGRTTVNSEEKHRSCPENYDEYGVTVRISDQFYKRVYQCMPQAAVR